ncbi:unnamed protein product [Vitrella brassicaformis CCMP3155]|uniref:Uncharacterized protein n=1 Tax=Vitrella brassicaformis (strain CCMP3155) TaxID=1169540 RepID=A0A0G4FAS6_VITBC|nr:unnamed protein product [Vitrella brassicaformis CCMP3155]|eukprot:CEM10006.1 unnamed protein product [Vitrella brassicaformis CCMP3155]
MSLCARQEAIISWLRTNIDRLGDEQTRDHISRAAKLTDGDGGEIDWEELTSLLKYALRTRAEEEGLSRSLVSYFLDTLEELHAKRESALELEASTKLYETRLQAKRLTEKIRTSCTKALSLLDKQANAPPPPLPPARPSPSLFPSPSPAHPLPRAKRSGTPRTPRS